MLRPAQGVPIPAEPKHADSESPAVWLAPIVLRSLEDLGFSDLNEAQIRSICELKWSSKTL